MGAFAGLLAQTTTYPLDVVRRRMQVMGSPAVGFKRVGKFPMYTGILNCMGRVLQREGFRGLYSGVTMNWIKGPIVCFFFVCVILLRYFRHSFSLHISGTVSTHTFEMQFQHSYFMCSFNTHILS